MKMIVPVAVTSANIMAHSVAPDPESNWSSGLGYTTGNRVIHDAMIYEAVADSAAKTPGTGTEWLAVHPIAKLRPFDTKLTTFVGAVDGAIEYEILMPKNGNAIAIFGMSGTSVRIEVPEQGFDRTIDLPNQSLIDRWWEWFYGERITTPELILEDVPAYLGTTVTITVTGAGVSEIVIGNAVSLGETLAGTTVSFRDFSTKEQNTFGDFEVVRRGYSVTIDYSFFVLFDQVRDVQRLVAARRATPTVYYAGPDTDHFGTTTYGISDDLRGALIGNGGTTFSLNTEGLKKW